VSAKHIVYARMAAAHDRRVEVKVNADTRSLTLSEWISDDTDNVRVDKSKRNLSITI